jgi:hypothetical protein
MLKNYIKNTPKKRRYTWRCYRYNLPNFR